MNIEEITIEDAKEKHRWVWKAFKHQFPNSDHESIRKMIEVVVGIQNGTIRDETLDD